MMQEEAERLARIAFAANTLALAEVKDFEPEQLSQRINEHISQFNELFAKLCQEWERAGKRGETHVEEEEDRLIAEITTLLLHSPSAFYRVRNFYERKNKPEIVDFLLECFEQTVQFLDEHIRKEWNELGKLYSPKEADITESLLSLAIKIAARANEIKEKGSSTEASKKCSSK